MITAEVIGRDRYEGISKMSFGTMFQILGNQQVACGFKLGPVAISNQNPIFEMTSCEKMIFYDDV